MCLKEAANRRGSAPATREGARCRCGGRMTRIEAVLQLVRDKVYIGADIHRIKGITPIWGRKCRVIV